MSSFDSTLSGLKKHHIERTPEEKKQLRELLNDVKDIRESYKLALDANPNLNQAGYFDFLASRLTHEFYKRGQCICHKGDPGKFMLILLSGRVGIAQPKTQEDIELQKETLYKIAEEKIEKARREIHMEMETVVIKARKKVEKVLGGREALNKLYKEAPEGSINDNTIIGMSKFHKIGFNTIDFMLLKIGNTPEYFDQGVIRYKVIAYRAQGDVLGEQALIYNQTRNSTVFACEGVHAACLSKESFQLIFRTKIEEEKEKFEFFQRILRTISQTGVTKVVNFFEKKCFSMNSLIFKVGQEISNIYVVLKGTVKIYRMAELDEDRSIRNPKVNELHLKNTRKIQIPLAILGYGEFFGEEDLRGGQSRYSYSAFSASAEVAVFAISTENFQKLEQSPEKPFVQLIFRKSEMKGEWFSSQAARSLNIRLHLHKKVYIPMDPSPPIPKEDHPSFHVDQKEPKEEMDIYSIMDEKRYKPKECFISPAHTAHIQRILKGECFTVKGENFLKGKRALLDQSALFKSIQSNPKAELSKLSSENCQQTIIKKAFLTKLPLFQKRKPTEALHKTPLKPPKEKAKELLSKPVNLFESFDFKENEAFSISSPKDSLFKSTRSKTLERSKSPFHSTISSPSPFLFPEFSPKFSRPFSNSHIRFRAISNHHSFSKRNTNRVSSPKSPNEFFAVGQPKRESFPK